MFLNNRVYYSPFFIQNILDQNKYLVSSVLINKQEYDQHIKPKKYKNILFNTEPIKHFSKEGDRYEFPYKGIIENKFDIIFGCINHDPENGRFKFPLYLFENKFDFKNSEQFIQINNEVLKMNAVSLKEKQFCTLINGWDPNNVRTCIYNKMRKIKDINCPGKLFNNCSNIELNRIGKAKYINKFLFNICSENYDNDNVDGYITEKLMDCCLGGAIPVYAGWLDEYDEKIFNKDRIIFYNSQDEKSIELAYNKVKELMEDDNKFQQFYQQPVFCETAYETIQMLLECFIQKIN
jgi:hypothetical protein